jgi:disulfide bond formation protein DsbB
MSKIGSYAGYGAFGVALMAMLGSFIMSELFHLIPCELCWYQRIFMYPLAIVIGVGIVKKDKSWPIVTLILSGIGWLIALYHVLLQWGVLPKEMATCTAGAVSCLDQQLNILGFIDIPLMSLGAFTAIIALTVIHWRGNQNEQRN